MKSFTLTSSPLIPLVLLSACVSAEPRDEIVSEDGEYRMLNSSERRARKQQVTDKWFPTRPTG
ncbi:hypothetical protein [Persicirhabdus sediminis]|uniref:Uncharacterized protein n=1 Tax=Persicirhabdus sediminis TaxID=454144 RepID=A0A8J7MHT5_9BACT|nr:hypothetical protein [Persicirhabdus sediminis]MBK1792214.1 hypothetical protein [Persicirhabdus sediminis]